MDAPLIALPLSQRQCPASCERKRQPSGPRMRRPIVQQCLHTATRIRRKFQHQSSAWHDRVKAKRRTVGTAKPNWAEHATDIIAQANPAHGRATTADFSAKFAAVMVEFSIFAVTIVLASCPNGPDDKAYAYREFCPLVYMLGHTARAYTHLGFALPWVTYYLHATQYFLFERVVYSLVLT